jgi:predicted transcriptional regulator
LPTHLFEHPAAESLETLKALASDTRLKILTMLADSDRNINQLAQALGMSQPTVSNHVAVLEEAGLVTSDYTSGIQGMQKRCRLVYDRLTFTFEGAPPPEVQVEEQEMPIGLFSWASPSAPCGIATAERLIDVQDVPYAFFRAERANAQILWMTMGYAEYTFANDLPAASVVRRIELSMEICSECKDYNNDYPSDITVWINGVDIGAWTSPGDMGGKRGRLNPAWWPQYCTQYGFLKTWAVDEQGSYVDGESVTARTVDELDLASGKPIRVRIGVRPEAANAGGFNLFGRRFGNHEQDIILRLHHSAARR